MAPKPQYLFEQEGASTSMVVSPPILSSGSLLAEQWMDFGEFLSPLVASVCHHWWNFLQITGVHSGPCGSWSSLLIIG